MEKLYQLFVQYELLLLCGVIIFCAFVVFRLYIYLKHKRKHKGKPPLFLTLVVPCLTIVGLLFSKEIMKIETAKAGITFSSELTEEEKQLLTQFRQCNSLEKGNRAKSFCDFSCP